MPSFTPNIVLITTDQHRADCFSFARSDIKTPHMDALASRGTRFNRCYCPGPLCQPARASILTGMLPLTHGVRDNGIDLPDDMIDRGFAQQLANTGYKTALLGKAHLSTQHTFERTGRPECRHTMAQYYDEWSGPYMGFDHVELFIDGPVKWPYWQPPHGLHFTKWLFADGNGNAKTALYDKGLRPTSGAQQTHVADLPLPWHTSSWLGDRASNFIMDHDGDAPFALWVSFPDPHHPFDAPEPYGRMYDPADIDIPKHHDLDLSRRPWWHEASLTGSPKTTEEFRAIREQLSRQKNLTEKQLRDITANYFGMISLVDHNVGRIMDALAQKGITDNTIVILTSDHGEFLGDHGLLFKGPMFYDSLTRVALLAAGPGIEEGKVVDNIVSTVDLTPTLIELGGGSIGDHYNGQSLQPLLQSGPPPDDMHDMAHIEWGLGSSRCGIDLDLRTVVTDRYRYTIELDSGEGEIYDLKNDPHEMVNLFNDPAYRTVGSDMEERRRSRPDDIRTEPLPIVGMS
jgi:arylsulfatase A-like enzyme